LGWLDLAFVWVATVSGADEEGVPPRRFIQNDEGAVFVLVPELIEEPKFIFALRAACSGPLRETI